ncbi:hypothetical protein G6F50_017555 [Rhizopus delemar]|uniref:Uncharacterized protein n=1 Tax=Rhizopus delemar TaxID=936053 RepID=A0A9P6XPV7_9FUNG|nr:hypothetical protein G6F50_017555 [Rhizopus delemar]
MWVRVGVDGNAEHVDGGAGVGAAVARQDQVELARSPRGLQHAGERALLQPPSAGHGHAQAQLPRMAHLAFAGLEAVAQQEHRPVRADVGGRRLGAGFAQQLVGEGGHHGSGNGAALPRMEWRDGAHVTA